MPVGFPLRNGLFGAVLAVLGAAVTVGIVPGSLAGAFFAFVPGVSLAIFACNAVVRFGSVMPFQPLSSFGAAIVSATFGSSDFLLVRVTVGAATERTPAERCENFPSWVTGFVPACRARLAVGIALPPVRTSALFMAWKFGPPLKIPCLLRAMLVTLTVFDITPAFCCRGRRTPAIERDPKSRAFTKLYARGPMP